MRLRAGLVLWLGLLSPACGGETLPVVRPPPAPPAPLPEPEYLEYVPSPEAWNHRTWVDGDTTVLAGPRHRTIFEKGRLPRVLASYGLTAFEKLPARLGGGYATWGDRLLGWTPTLDGEPRGLRSFSESVRGVVPHAEGLLVLLGGRRALLDPKTGAAKPMRPFGLTGAALAEDGRAVALLAVGDVVGREGDGAWKPLAAPGVVLSVAKELVDGIEELTLTTQSGLFLAPRGGLPLRELARSYAPRPPPPRLGVDARWHDPVSPLTRALTEGFSAGPGRAHVASEGNLFLVSLVDGSISAVTRGVYPPEKSCRVVVLEGGPPQPSSSKKEWQPTPVDVPRSPFDAPSAAPSRATPDVLLLCSNSQSAVVVAGLGAQPRTEKVLLGGGHFFVGSDGAVAYMAPLPEPPADKPSDPKKPKTARERNNQQGIWLRTPNGSWSEVPGVAASVELVKPPAADAAKEPEEPVVRPPPNKKSPPQERPKPKEPEGASLLRPVPSAAGVLLFVAEGGRLHLVDPQKQTAKQVDLSAIEAGARASLVSWLGRLELVDRAVLALPGGGYRFLSSGAPAVELEGDGARPSARELSSIWASGQRALGWSSQGRLFQTADGGGTWEEVAAPPEPPGDGLCGPLGCRVGQYLRFGWRHSAPPAAQAPAAPRLGAPPEAQVELPELRCTATAKAVQRDRPPRVDGKGPLLGLGATELGAFPEGTQPIAFGRSTWPNVGGEGDTFAVVAGAPPSFDANGLRLGGAHLDRKLQVVDPLDPDAVIRSATLKMTPVEALYRQHEPSFEFWMDNASLTFLPVTPGFGAKGPSALLGLAGASAGGAVGRWDGRDAPFVWDPTGAAGPRSAVGRGAATLLLRDDGQVARLTDFGGQRLRTLPSEVLGERDVLGVGQDGVAYLVRTPSAERPPTEEDPGLAVPLFAADDAALPLSTARAMVLAPWSTLTPANDPSCKDDKAGVRVLLNTAAAWLRTAEWEDGSSMRALVRWSGRRACLEAVELAAPSAGREAADVLIARFDDAKPRASLVRFAQGLERRQAQSCSLAPPSRP